MYLKNFTTKETPQSEPIPGTNQIQNSAGGFVWEASIWDKLDRFLILGSEGGSYYATERELTRKNIDNLIRCIREDGSRTVLRITDVSNRGLAPKNDPALFALAACCSFGDESTKKLAFENLQFIARIGTHILHFVQFLEQFRGGWGRAPKRAIQNWFLRRSARDLAYQAIKYQSRDGWSLRDLLRLSHPKTDPGSRQVVFDWILHGWPTVGDMTHPDQAIQQIWAFEQAKKATSARRIVQLIQAYDLPREAIPTQFLNESGVWEALLPKMGLEAMIRSLGKMSNVGLLKPMSEAAHLIREKLSDRASIRSSRLHPIKILTALMTYGSGKGVKGSLTWTPVPRVLDALDSAFYLAFENIEKTGRRYCLALDISGSMGTDREDNWVAGVPHLTPRIASAALSLVTASIEENHYVMGFGHSFHSLNLSPRQRLDDAVRAISDLPFDSTDCSIPMRWAQHHQIPIDNFVIYTDSETWFGDIHPSQALVQYRQSMGINAKLAVVGMVSNEFTIADPADDGMMDFVGFSTDTPSVLNWFLSK